MRNGLARYWRFATMLLTGLCIGSGAQAAERSLLISDVTLIDGTGSVAQPHRDVTVRDGRIVAITAAGKHRNRRDQIDGRGRFLMPGMMDIHVHLVGGALAWGKDTAGRAGTFDEAAGLRALQGYLHAGFTTVYDAGNAPDYIFALRARERRGDIASPRIFATGHYLTTSGGWGAQPGGAQLGIGLPDWPMAIADLNAQIARAPDMQKIVYESSGIGPSPMIAMLPKPLMKDAITYLHQRHIRTTVHVSTEMAARDAIDAGVDSFAHTPAVGLLSRDFIAMVAARQIPFATTMAVFDEIIQLGKGTDYLDGPDYVALMTPEERAMRAAVRDTYVKTGWPGWFAAITPYLNKNIRALHDAGAILALGTDKSYAPLALHELDLLAASGIAPRDIIRIATLNAALYLGKADELGSIAVGKRADMLLLDADPTADIAHVRRIAAVIKDGRLVDRRRLDLPVNRQR